MKRMFVFVAGLVVAGALGVGASPAAADAATGGSTTARSSVALPAQERLVERGKYWTHARCVAAGAKGAAEGRWSRYYCASGAAFWVLWTDR